MSESTHAFQLAKSSGAGAPGDALWPVRSNSASETPDTLIEWGQVHERNGDRGAARDAYTRALALLEIAAEPQREVRVLRWIARTHQVDAEYETALTFIDAAEKLATRIEDRSGLGHCRIVRANISWQRGDLDGAVALYTAALDLAHEVGDAHLAAV
jgi:tetratricopeptide (TPR) repeat protein